jgi:hypothetical protein
MKKFLVLAVAAALTLMSIPASAYTVKVDDDTYGRVALLGQVAFSAVNGPAGADHVADQTITNARIAIGGQVTDLYKFGFNFDMNVGRDAAGAPARPSALADGFILLDFAKEFKVMTGIYRMAVTRFALTDSYTYLIPSAPDVAAAKFLSSSLAGYRSGGATLWGDLANGMIRYNLSAYDGDYSAAPGIVTAATNSNDQPGVSARIAVNLLDPEKGYTYVGTNLGKGRIATIGAGYLQQDYLSGTTEKTYTVATVDAFYDVDALTAQFAYFQYDYDNAAGQKPAGWYAGAGYMLGKFQPVIRYESWDDDVSGNDNTDFTTLAAGVNYAIEGHDAKIQLAYAKKNFEGTGVDTDTATLQLQVRF